MATKTGKEIEGDIFTLLKSSIICNGKTGVKGINGSVYRKGTRPRDSQKEDMVVIFTTANAMQFQEGVVTVNIYVPALRIDKSGVMVEDGARCEAIERLSQDAVKALKANVSDYKFSLERAIHTTQDAQINQSFVVIPLKFKYYHN